MLGTLASPVLAIDYVFVPYEFPDEITGHWHNQLDWLPHGTPGAGDTVTIAAREDGGYSYPLQCHILATEAYNVGVLTIEGTCSTFLAIEAGGMLTLYGDATIDGGSIVFTYPEIAMPDPPPCSARGELRIGANLTVSGDGGKIYGAVDGDCDGFMHPGRITSALLAGGIPAQLTIETSAGAENAFRILGYIDIQARLVNNAKVVVADGPDVLRLSTHGEDWQRGLGLRCRTDGRGHRVHWFDGRRLRPRGHLRRQRVVLHNRQPCVHR